MPASAPAWPDVGPGGVATIVNPAGAAEPRAPLGVVPRECSKRLEPHMENPPPFRGEGFMVELSGVEPLTS